jgi:hypothetical protein
VSAPLPPVGADGRATRWTVSGGWRPGDQHFAGVALDPAAAGLPEVAVKWVEEDGPCLFVAAWDYGVAMRTHARLWKERRDAEKGSSR